jgi:hypothetical protein
MTQADRVLSTPPTNTPISQGYPEAVTSRRRFLSQAAGVAAGGAAMALAAIPPATAASAPTSPLDAIYGLIETHRAAHAAHLVVCDGQDRLEQMGGPSSDVAEGPCNADMDAIHELIQTAPTTLAGLVAWAAYLNEVEAWMIQEAGAPLVATLNTALGNLAVSS